LKQVLYGDEQSLLVLQATILQLVRGQNLPFQPIGIHRVSEFTHAPFWHVAPAQSALVVQLHCPLSHVCPAAHWLLFVQEADNSQFPGTTSELPNSASQSG
jgi:hypothetical protein